MTNPAETKPIVPTLEDAIGHQQGIVVDCGDSIYEQAKLDYLRELQSIRNQPVPVKLPAMPMEIQEWCWHLDTAMEQDARHKAMALGSAWPVISKWLRSVVGHAKQSGKAFTEQPVPVEPKTGILHGDVVVLKSDFDALLSQLQVATVAADMAMKASEFNRQLKEQAESALRAAQDALDTVISHRGTVAERIKVVANLLTSAWARNRRMVELLNNPTSAMIRAADGHVTPHAVFTAMSAELLREADK